MMARPTLLLILLVTACGASEPGPLGLSPDGGVAADLDTVVDGRGPPCDVDSDCAPGWKCLFWKQAPATGVCEPRCPTGFDAALTTYCGCDGVVRPGIMCTDFPWSHEGTTEEERDAGLTDGGGLAQPGGRCLPGPVCGDR